MAEIIETVPFNYDDLYTALETKFSDKGYDIYDGSNTAQLITAMAYLTSMLNVNTAVNINETILPLTRKLDNAKQNARVLGYEVSHTQSYKYKLTLKFSAGSYTINKYSEFTGTEKTYYYMGDTIELINVPDDYTITIEVKEGTLYKYVEHSDVLTTTIGTIENDLGETVAQTYIDIPYTNVENDGLDVFLTYYDTDGLAYNKEEWTKVSQFEIDLNDTVFKQYVRIDDIDYKTPRIYFKLANIGSELDEGTIVDVNVLTSSGYEGALPSTDVSELTHDYDFEITNISLQLQGTDDESLESIQNNAPLFNNAANRAVTKDDYTVICNKESTVKKSMVWGGDDEFPKSPGHIWFSFLPSTNSRTFSKNSDLKTEFNLDISEDEVNWYIEDEEIRSTSYDSYGNIIDKGVFDILDGYKIPTLEFHNRHPLYLDFNYELNVVKYNIKTSKADIHQSIFDVIDNEFVKTDGYEDFEVEYFNSSLFKKIDTELTDITGFNGSVTNQIMINKKSISNESSNSDHRDLFINLAVPYETYFSASGDLISSKLPNIDTEDFGSYDIYTDWSSVSATSSDKIIIAPVRCKSSETKIYNISMENSVELSNRIYDNIKIYINDTLNTNYNLTINSYIEFDNLYEASDIINIFVNENAFIEDIDYEILDNKTIQFFNSINETDTIKILINSEELSKDYYSLKNYDVINFSDTIVHNSTIKILSENIIGKYYLFNSYKKSISIHLYVDARGYNDEEIDLYSEPSNYLTTTDNYYGFTTEDFYLTTNGYTISTTDENITYSSTIPDGYNSIPYYVADKGYVLFNATNYSGNIIDYYTPYVYKRSNLKMISFINSVYLDLKYNSPNFKVSKNIIPRLRSVKFV